MSDKWKKILGAVAPTLATAYGGPLVGAAVSALSRAVLNKDDGTEEEIAQAVASGNPEILLKLKEADTAFKVRMEELGVDLVALHAKDRDSARQREIAIRDNTPKILASVVVVGFFGVLAYMFKYGVPKEGDEALLILLGALGAGFGMVLSYYFGSSSGSVQKNAIMERLTK